MIFQNKINLDEIDFKILSELQVNARISFANLGRSVGLSRPAVVERIKRLEESQVIEGYQAKINLKNVGLYITAFLRIAVVSDQKWDQVLKLAETIPEILECHRVTGEEDVIAKVVASSIDHLRDVIDHICENNRAITMIVLTSASEKQSINDILQQKLPSSPQIEK